MITIKKIIGSIKKIFATYYRNVIIIVEWLIQVIPKKDPYSTQSGNFLLRYLKPL